MDLVRLMNLSFAAVWRTQTLALVLVTGTAWAAPASARPPAPLLSISVDDEKGEANAGTEHRYTVKVRNEGRIDVKRLRVDQSLPEGLKAEEIDAGGKAVGNSVVWTVDVPAGGESAVHLAAKATVTPGQLMNISTTACARLAAKSAPLVCSTDANITPAGIAAKQAADGTAPWGLLTTAGAAAIAIIGAAFGFFRRRARTAADRAPAEVA